MGDPSLSRVAVYPLDSAAGLRYPPRSSHDFLKCSAPPIMSSEPRSPAPAYDSDAEKGILDKVAVFPVEKKPLSAPSDEKKDVFPDEKKALAVFSAPEAKKDPFASMKASGKRKPASKVIVAKLWYNTYR